MEKMVFDVAGYFVDATKEAISAAKNHPQLAGYCFLPNPWLWSGFGSFDKFRTGISQLLLQQQGKQPGRYDIRLVFHGTPCRNVVPILRDGLDPKKRYYFSVNVSEAACKCSTCCQMIVVFVIAVTPRERRRRESVFVVQNNYHQLPIGALYHQGCGPQPTEQKKFLVAERYCNLEKLLLMRDYDKKQRIETVKAAILTYVQDGRIEMACDLLHKYRDIFNHELEQDELDSLLRDLLGLDLCCSSIFREFPGLLAPVLKQKEAS